MSLYAGTLPGALPALGGWTAYTGEIGLSGILLFLIVLFWQIPHFLALAWIYRIDYKQAGFKMHTYEGDSSGNRISVLSIVYTICAIASALLLWQYSKLGFVYLLGVFYFHYSCCMHAYNLCYIRIIRVQSFNYMHHMHIYREYFC